MEPLTIEQAKAQLRQFDDWEDTLIAEKIVAAREFVEGCTDHILVRRQVAETRDHFAGHIELRHWPVVSVDSITYTSSSGVASPYSGFVASENRRPARVYPSLTGWWPTLGRSGEVTITYTAGYNEGEVPADFTEAMLVIIAGTFSDREGAGAYEKSLETARRILHRYRRPL